MYVSGANSGLNLKTGSTNLLIGTSVGNLYTGSESNNILISSPGVAGESNVLRIGTQGGGVEDVNKAFIAGIYNTTPVGATTQNVIIDSNGQLGTGGSGFEEKYTATAISYQVLKTDGIIGVTSTAAPRTITMPNSGIVLDKMDNVRTKQAVQQQITLLFLVMEQM